VALLQSPQVWLARLQSLPPPQSLFELQPQTPPARHMWPTALVLQSTQAPPEVPQALLALPGAQPVPEQQPPEQLPLPGPPQAPVQTPAAQVGVRSLQPPQAAPAVPQEELVWLA
jgi:hypothetical protein